MTTRSVRKVLVAAAATLLAAVGFLVPAAPAGAQTAVFGDALYDVPFGPADLGSVAVDYPYTGSSAAITFRASVRSPLPFSAWSEGDGVYWFLRVQGSAADVDYVVAIVKVYGSVFGGVFSGDASRQLCSISQITQYGDTYQATAASCSPFYANPTLYVSAMTSFLADAADPGSEVNDVAPQVGWAGPVYRGSTMPEGQVQSIDSQPGSGVVRILGWARDPDTPVPIDVVVYLDGKGAARTTADLSRPDVGPHGFDAYVAASPGLHQVCAYALNDAEGPNALLSCQAITVANEEPVGAFDQAIWQGSGVVVSGWALDPDGGPTASRIRISAAAGTNPVAYASADQSRPDIGALYPSSGPNHGFAAQYTFTDPYTPTMRTLCVRALNVVEVGAIDNGTDLGCRLPVLDAPGAPTAVAGLESATVSWPPVLQSAPPGAMATGFRVTVSPGGATKDVGVGTSSTTIEGLTGGIEYTFTVSALNEGGVGVPSVPTNPVTPTSRPGAGFNPVVPFRALDSRTSTGGWSTALGAGASADLVVAGANGIPATASAVVMNVTVTGGTAGSYLTAYPAGAARPLAANLNFSPQQTVPNLVTAKLGAGGAVTFYNAKGNVHVVADVVGYYDDGVTGVGDRFGGETPTRLLDSRTATGGWASTPLGSGQTRDVTVAGAAGVPPTATGVVMNVTVTGGTTASYLQAFPAGATQPVTANLLFAPNQTVSNLVTVKLGTAGKVSLFNQQGSVHVVADVVGWFGPTGDLFHAVSPTRVLDSRSATGGWASTALGPGQSRPVPVGGVLGIPMAATAVVANLVAVQPTTGTYLTDFPAGQAVPVAASLLVAPGEIRPNLTTVALGTGTQLAVFNQLGTVHVVIDVAGYYAPT